MQSSWTGHNMIESNVIHAGAFPDCWSFISSETPLWMYMCTEIWSDFPILCLLDTRGKLSSVSLKTKTWKEKQKTRKKMKREERKLGFNSHKRSKRLIRINAWSLSATKLLTQKSFLDTYKSSNKKKLKFKKG